MRDPINPADIRVGDRVERVSESRGVETITRCVIARIEGGIIHAGGLGWSVCDTNGEWFLLDRPDPLAEALGESAPVQMRTPQQARMLGAALKELSMDDPAEALAFMAGIIGHPLAATRDLTADECADVLDRLREMATEAERLAAESDVVDAEIVDDETGEVFDQPLIGGTE